MLYISHAPEFRTVSLFEVNENGTERLKKKFKEPLGAISTTENVFVVETRLFALHQRKAVDQLLEWNFISSHVYSDVAWTTIM